MSVCVPTKTDVDDAPCLGSLDRDANVVVVEGALDDLAIAATAAHHGELSKFAPATTSGVTVSDIQANAVLSLHAKPPVIALDGGRAGREGTDRWLTALCVERGPPALVTRLPDGVDPAEWAQHQGVSGLWAFDRRGCTGGEADTPRPALPGRDLVRICFDQPAEPVRHVLDVLTPLAIRLREGAEITTSQWLSFDAKAYRLLSELVGPERTGTRKGIVSHARLSRAVDGFPSPLAEPNPSITAVEPADPASTRTLDRLTCTLGVLADMVATERTA